LWVTGLLGLFGAPEPWLEGAEEVDPAHRGGSSPQTGQ
jgi:hypothetical protein